MPNIVDNAPWFGDLVQRRRRMLGMHRTHVADAGGPDVRTSKKIELGLGSTNAAVLNRLDLALQWEPGSSFRALGGGESSTAAAGYLIQSVAAPAAAPGRSNAPTDNAVTDDESNDRYLTPAEATDGRARPPQERAKRTRRKILFAVARTIAQHGTAGSIDKILAGGAVTKDAVYFHFDSKDAIITAMLEEAASLSAVLGFSAALDDRGGAASALVAEYITEARDVPLLHAEAVLWNDPAYTDTARAGTYRTLRAALIDILGETREQAAAVDLADAVMAILVGVLSIHGEHRGLADPAAAATVQRLIARVLR